MKSYDEFWMNIQSPVLTADVPAAETTFLSEVRCLVGVYNDFYWSIHNSNIAIGCR